MDAGGTAEPCLPASTAKTKDQIPIAGKEGKMLKYVGPLLVVEDITVSRRFYEDCLGQKVEYDFGENVSFVGNFSIHRKAHYQSLMGDQANFTITPKSNDAELYFETDEIEDLQQRLRQAGIEFIHEIREQPWSQRVMRVYDPDGHILEIGESMENAVLRLHRQGWSLESICQKTGMPRRFVEQAIETQNA